MRLTRRLTRMMRDCRGANAVEFAMVAPLFLMLMLGILDLGLTLFTQVVLDGGARDAARQIRTGQIKAGGQAAFAAILANDTAALIPTGQINYYVNLMPNYAAATAPAYTASNPSGNPPVVGGFGNPPQQQSFNPGGPGSPMIVTVAYQRNSLVPFIGNWLGSVWNNTTLMSTVIFQNEP
jgi:Flp pilus assembly protein TadG